MQTLTFEINIMPNRAISGDLRYNPSTLKMPIAIIMHGFKGNKNWGFLPILSEQFAEMGYLAINYNHSLNGNIPNSIQYDMDKFRRITISAQLNELDMIISAIKSGELVPQLDINHLWNGEILLCGHSMGAAVALVYAAENRISKLIMIAPISKFDRYTERQKKQWRLDGKIEFYNPKIEQTMILNSSFIDDMDENLERFNLLNAIAKCESHILIAHGEQDVTVPIKEAFALYENSNRDNCTLNKFPHCNHSFNLDTLGTVRNPHLTELQSIIREFAKI